ELRKAVQQAHQFVTFATSSPMQAAVAQALRLPDSYFAQLRRDYERRRDKLVAALRGAGLPPYPPEGTYFVVADTRAFAPAGDFEFCRWLTREVGVAAIPPSAFYGEA